MKIIIDANLWISFLIGKRLQDMKSLCQNENISVFYCDEIIEEFIRVSNKPKIKKLGIDEHNISVVLEFIRTHCISATFRSIEGYIVRDPNDAYLLALADATNANFILTGDKDLLVLESHNITKIVSYSEFIELHYEP